jgi:hypothetical protein
MPWPIQVLLGTGFCLFSSHAACCIHISNLLCVLKSPSGPAILIPSQSHSSITLVLQAHIDSLGSEELKHRVGLLKEEIDELRAGESLNFHVGRILY